MRVLVACEFSGIVREAFRMCGHDAWSCDLLPTEIPGQHIQADVRTIVGEGWDMMIAHPPCTALACSGNRWYAGTQAREDALVLVWALLHAPITRIAIENPIGVISTRIRKPDQIIQPWMFGHGETKATCLWLNFLPPLMSSCIATERRTLVWKHPETKDRWKNRSRTYTGIAEAMATQWGNLT